MPNDAALKGRRVRPGPRERGAPLRQPVLRRDAEGVVDRQEQPMVVKEEVIDAQTPDGPMAMPSPRPLMSLPRKRKFRL